MTTETSGPRSRGPYVSPTVRVYDRVYRWKDYAAEARRIRDLVRRFGPASARTLLDVACGTGSHLRYLSRWYDTVGLDVNLEMLQVARRKLPAVRFVRGSMQNFRLPERFDVITCLFSAIGYVRSEADLRRTLANFARHLHPGGILIVEPWLTPATYAEGSVHVGTYGTKAQPIVRMDTSLRRGSRSVMDMHYLVAGRGRVHHWVERHNLALFDVPTQLAAYRAAGLRVRYLPSQFTTRRGLFVAVRLTSGRTQQRGAVVHRPRPRVRPAR
jgi:ubiquinone/menaquinone biosynthesis C-methylase UbiE